MLENPLDGFIAGFERAPRAMAKVMTTIASRI